MVSNNLLPKAGPETTQAFDDLVGKSLCTFLLVTVLVAWGWAVVTLTFAADLHSLHAYAVLGLTLVTAWASYGLHTRHLRLAVGVYLCGLTLAVTIIALTFPDTATVYLYILVVLITAALTNAWITGGVALASVGLLVGSISIGGRTMPFTDVAPPIIFIFLAALAVGLSSQQLTTALAWALAMTHQAQQSAEEARKHRAEVQRLLKSLDIAYARLERANRDLIFAREAAEKAYRFKAEFVANVSHELRTPLNLIVGFSEMMATAPESYGGVALPSRYRGDVAAIYRSARHLSDLIDDVLDLSQIEAGRMPLVKEAADLAEVVREATDMVQGLVQAHKLQLEVDLPDDLPKLRLDRTRIRQVLLNLLTNATRFTDTGGIRVRVRSEGQHVMLIVQDSGRGIPPDRLAAAFEGFSQLHEDHVPEGSGLGLAVSKKFIELHGGRIWIESEVGRGTTVSCTLPIPRDEQDVQAVPLRTGVSLRSHEQRPAVLVLHDDSRILGLLRRHVDGYQFVLADAVARACAIMRETPPAAVIMDAVWAERWGANVAGLNLPSQLPVLTCPLPSSRQVALLLGATDFLPKPVTREDLARALSRLPKPAHNVLVVDDDPHIVRLLARMLKANDSSLRVLKAFGGKEGLEIARTQQPDTVLLDLLMPELNGYDLLEEMTHDAATAQTQVIIVSVRSAEQEAAPILGELRLGRAAGFSLTELLQCLQAMLATITQPSVRFPASGATRLEVQPG